MGRFSEFSCKCRSFFSSIELNCFSLKTVANLKEDLPKVFSTDNPQGLVVNNEKYIFIRNIGNAAVLRKGADGMVVTKTNQGGNSSMNHFDD